MKDVTDYVFTCQCQRHHSREDTHKNIEGPCGRIERRSLPKRGPPPTICDGCLEAYNDDYNMENCTWVDPPDSVRAEAVFDEEVAIGFGDHNALHGDEPEIIDVPAGKGKRRLPNEMDRQISARGILPRERRLLERLRHFSVEHTDDA